jgi:NitT/TauT family transport system substrate-binding protein
MVQALLAGQLDVGHLGIGPAMVARGKGVLIKVVAASTVEQIAIVALPKLKAAFEAGDAKTAFARFEETYGRKPVIAIFPVGSVPETVLRYWVQKHLGLPKGAIQMIYQGAV